MIRLERTGAVTALVLARPQMGNALVPELLQTLQACLAQVQNDRGCHAVVLAAEGEVFSLGGDMRRFAREYKGDIEAYAFHLVGLLNQCILALIDLPQPVVAAVQGHVTGGSVGLVLASDLVVLAQEAVLKAHYLNAGFAPDGGWSALLPARIGRGRAAAALLLNHSIRAAEAAEWGLATKVLPGEQVAAEAQRLAQQLALAPPSTLQSAKRLLWGERETIAAGLESERRAFVAQVAGARDGVSHFLERFTTYPREV